MSWPWPSGAVTGIGSLPGTDAIEAARLVMGEVPELPYLPELPGRGAGADMIGRAAALLVDLPVEIVPSGWRLTARAGHDLRAARDYLERDLDALEQAAAGHRGAVKVQVAGPWTLAASLELPSGHRAVSDHGATRELAESLAEGVRRHLADVARRVPGASVVLQLDEPSVPAVLTGQVPTPSGWGTVRAVNANAVEQALGAVLSVASTGVVHCCAPGAPLGLFRSAGAQALAVDAAQLDGPVLDAIGEAIDAGLAVVLGVVPGLDAPIAVEQVVLRVDRFWTALGFPRSRLPEIVLLSSACGLAGASPSYAREVMSALREAARQLAEASG